MTASSEYRNIGILFLNLNVPAKRILKSLLQILATMSAKLRYSLSIRGKGTCCRFVSCYFWLLVACGSLPSAQECETASKMGTPTGMWAT